MSTYNAYLNKKATVGNDIPVWCGVVRPARVGASLASAFAKAGAFIPDGCPLEVKNGVATPFLAYEVISVATESTDTLITVKANIEGYKPATTDFLQKVGATFDTKGKAWNPDAVAEGSVEGQYVITVATANIDSVAEGDAIAISSATAEGSNKSLKYAPTHYLYNDIAIDAEGVGETIENIQASCALVNFHGEGLFINRTPAKCVKVAMKAAVPSVIQEDRF